MVGTAPELVNIAHNVSTWPKPTEVARRRPTQPAAGQRSTAMNVWVQRLLARAPSPSVDSDELSAPHGGARPQTKPLGETPPSSALEVGLSIQGSWERKQPQRNDAWARHAEHEAWSRSNQWPHCSDLAPATSSGENWFHQQERTRTCFALLFLLCSPMRPAAGANMRATCGEYKEAIGRPEIGPCVRRRTRSLVRVYECATSLMWFSCGLEWVA